MDSKKIFRTIFCILFFFVFSCSASVPDPEPDAPCPNWAYLDSLGGQAKSDPSIQAWSGRLIVAVQGNDDGIWVKEWNATDLTSWYAIPNGSTSSRPKLAVVNGTLRLYVKGSNGLVYSAGFIGSGEWSAWSNEGVANSGFGNAGPAVSAGYKAYTVYSNSSVKLGECVEPYSPDWTDGLIIYEIATREYTSPHGPETGDFAGLRSKMPYLSELGVTGIWLTGHSWSDPHHFGNIWTQYACIRPDVLDPILGTEQDFKDMIDEAHNYGIRVFLDVIDHGVVNSSNLIGEHPAWFRSDENPWRWIREDHKCPWSMTDYDWTGDQPELESFWINTWTSYVTEYGVDGYRIDLGSFRYDLWARIKDNCRKQGRDIVVFEEGAAGSGDYGRLYKFYDFYQWGLDILGGAQQYGNPISGRPVFTDPECLKYGLYAVNLSYSDGASVYLQVPKKIGAVPARVEGRVLGAYLGKTEDNIGTVSKEPDGITDHEIVIVGIDAGKTVSNVKVWDTEIIGVSGMWNSSGGCWYDNYSVSGDVVEIFFSPYEAENVSGAYRELRFNTVQLSCHDYWDYNLKGSRFKMGYGLMFTPFIPLFMAGEEFDNPYSEVPNKTGRCVVLGYQNCSYNPWLYASEMQWHLLNESASRGTFEDFKKAISIRKNYTSLKYFAPSISQANIASVDEYSSDADIPMPYIRWAGNETVLVVGNPDPLRSAAVTLNVKKELDEINSAAAEYEIEDLWKGGSDTRNASYLEAFNCTVAPDNFRIFRIEPLTSSTSTTSSTSSTTTSTSSSSTTSTSVACALPGNDPPCVEVTLSEVVGAINQWAIGDFALGDVIDLINSWADPISHPPA